MSRIDTYPGLGTPSISGSSPVGGSTEANYVSQFVSMVVNRDLDAKVLDESLLNTVFQEISRSEEFCSPYRDSRGNWEWHYSEAFRRGRLFEPWIDSLIHEQHGSDQPFPKWPDGKPFALCLTHDVDEVTRSGLWRRIPRPFVNQVRARGGIRGVSIGFARSVGRLLRRLRHRDRDALWHYEDWLKLEDRFGFRSTFFVFPTRIQDLHPHDEDYRLDDPIVYDGKKMRVSEMIKSIALSGWEIGLHGSFQSATVPGLLEEQKKEIEDWIGLSIISTRQHYLHYDVSCTPRLQALAGFKVDLTQGFARTVGFRSGTSHPYFNWDFESRSALQVLEVPLVIMDVCLFEKTGLSYDTDLAIRHCIEIVDAVAAVGGCLTLNWHPNYINDARYWRTYEAVLEYSRSKNAWGTSANQICEWYIQRLHSMSGVCEE
jgi:hypothetical protein